MRGLSGVTGQDSDAFYALKKLETMNLLEVIEAHDFASFPDFEAHKVLDWDKLEDIRLQAKQVDDLSEAALRKEIARCVERYDLIIEGDALDGWQAGLRKNVENRKHGSKKQR